MARGKHELPRKGLGKYKKSHILLVSLLLIMTIGVGATVAFVMDSTDALVNIFNPSQVSCEVVEEQFDGKVKENVSIKNTSDIPAYIRAAVIVTWQDGKGNVYGKVPLKDTDYTITYVNVSDTTTVDPDNPKWIKGADGYYYWSNPVDPSTENNPKTTGVLIESCTLAEGATPPTDYYLSVEIIAEAIQADGMDATSAQDAFAKAAATGGVT